jgi:hypothetical protein
MKTKRWPDQANWQLGPKKPMKRHLRRTKSQPGLRSCSSEREAESGWEKRRRPAQMWP